MRTRILLFLFVLLLIVHSVTHAATTNPISQGCRNPKQPSGGGGFVNYGGATAFGDGVHDDTQAILDAFNLGRQPGGPASGATPCAIYIPPGTYNVTKMIQIWTNTSVYGEPSAPPTIILQPNSPFFASGNANPFVTYNGIYNNGPYSTNWSKRDQVTWLDTNNLFFISVNNVNFRVMANNPGCHWVFLYAAAQETGLRNCTLTRDDSIGVVLANTDTPGGVSGGGGGIVSNVTCNGGATAYQVSWYSQICIRGCTFNGPVLVGPTFCWGIDFVKCTFNNPSGTGFVGSATLAFTMDDCTFTSGTPLNPGTGSCHLENIQFSPGRVPSFLGGSADVNGHVIQYTTNQNGCYYNKVNEPGTAANFNNSVRSAPFPTTQWPFPSAAAVSILNYGGNGNGSFDNKNAIAAAFAASNEVIFPVGNYFTSATIALAPGQKMWGHGVEITYITGSSSPLISVAGNGTGLQSVLIGMSLYASSFPIVSWSADPASYFADMGFQISTGTSAAQVALDIIGGGGIFENTDTFPAQTIQSLATGCRLNNVNGLWGFEFSHQHWGSDFTLGAIQINNSNNVHIVCSQGENNPLYMSISNSTNVSVTNALAGNHGVLEPALISVSGSTVSLWCNQLSNCGRPGGYTAGIGEVLEATIGYGQAYSGDGFIGGGLLDGYVDFSAITKIPSVIASAATVGSNRATLNGSITSNGLQTITGDGFDYGDANGFSGNYTHSIASATVQIGGFSASLSGLTNGATYHYRAHALNSKGTGMSGDIAFTPTPALTPPPNTGPYKGIASPVPGIVYASNYDLGGQGIGYQDSINADPGTYRRDGVDLKPTSDAALVGTGYVLGWRTAGEWTRYTVNSQSGKYTLSARVESDFNTGKFHIAVDGTTVIAPVLVPLTGPWDTASSWKTLNLGTVTLTAGMHVVTVFVDVAWFDINYLSFVPVQGQIPVKYVQGAYATPLTQQGTVLVAYPAAQTSGNLNVVIVGWNDTAAVVSSVRDAKGTVYQLAVGPKLLSGLLSQSIYYAKNIPAASAGANAVTVTFNQPPIYADIRILEYSGLNQTNPLDVSASAVGNSANSSSGALTTTSATDLLIGANMVQSSTNGAGSGFKQRLLTPDGDIAEDEVVTSVGTYTASTPLSASGGWVMQLVAFHQ